jgi:hypothetical protein
MLRKGVRLLHDNAPANSTHVTTKLSASLGYEILPYPPYSPDMAPSDVFLFPRLKHPPRSKRFQDDDDVISSVKDFLNSQNETFYNQGIQMVLHRWVKYVAFQGAYVEKD